MDDPEIVDFNEELDARAARDMEEDGMPTSPLMFGPTGRGMSPEMELIPLRKLYSNSAKALRSADFDDSHLKDPTNLALNEQQIEEENQFDEMIDRVYKATKKPVKSAVRTMSKAKLPVRTMSKAKLPPKKGGTRKRSTRRRSRRSGRSRKSKRSRKNKRR